MRLLAEFGIPICVLCIAFACATPAQVRAETPSRVDEISLAYSPRAIVADDDLVTPRTLRGGAALGLTARYARTNVDDAHRVRFDFSQATLYTQENFDYRTWPDDEPATTSGSPVTYVRVDYAYLRSIPLREGLHLRVGGAVDIDLQSADWVYHPFAYGAYFGAFALDARGEFEYRPNRRHSVTTELSIPLFAWVTRSPYAVHDDWTIQANRDHSGAKTFFRYVGNGEFQSFNRYRGLRIGVRYTWYPGETWGLLAGARMRLVANTTPRHVLAQEYVLALGVTARF